MTVAIAGSPNLTFRATGGATNSPPIPSGSNGESLVLITICNGSSVPAPSGWNTAISGAFIDGNWKLWVFWRTRDGSEGANVTVDPDAGTHRNTVYAFSGTNTNRPVGAYQTRRFKAAGTNMPAPGIDVPQNSGMLFIGFRGATSWNSASEDPSTIGNDTGMAAFTFVGDHSSTTTEGWVHQFSTADGSVRTQGERTCTATGGSSSFGIGIALIIAANDVEDVLITTTGAGSMTAPAGASAVRMQNTGGGGGAPTSTSAEGGGGGGACSETNSIAVTGGSSTVFYSVGTGGSVGNAGGDSWSRVGTNSAPSSTTDGCLAKGGSSGATQTGGIGGLTSTSVGDSKVAGFDGATGQGGGGSRAGSGGGASGDTGFAGGSATAGSGNVIGVGGLGGSQAGNGGDGGQSAAAGVAGDPPGGGGGGGGNSGGNGGAGARGQVRLIFTLSGPAIGRSDETDTAFARGPVLQPQRANETDTALKPSNPTVTQTMGRATPVRQATQSYAGVADGSGNAVLSLAGLNVRAADTVFVQVGIQANTTTPPNGTGNNQGAYVDGGTQYVNGVNDINVWFGWRLQEGTPDSQVTLANMGAGQRYVAQVIIYSSVNFSAFAGTDGAQSTSSSNADPPSFTPGIFADMLIFSYGAAMDNAQTWTTAPANINNFTQVDDQDSVGHGARIGWGEVIYVQGSGAFNANAASNSGTTANDTAHGLVMGVQGAYGAQERDFAITRGPALGVNRANETDTAFALSMGVIQIPAGMATETDTAFKAGGIGMAANRANETDTASQRSINLSFVRANETDTAFARPQQGGIGISIENDTAFKAGGIAIAPQRANETDTASALQLIIASAVKRADEVDTAGGFTVSISHGQSVENDTAFSRAATLIRSVGMATEADTATARNPLVIRPVGFAAEVNSAFRLGMGLSFGRGNEADSAFARQAKVIMFVDRADEFDTAFQMFGALIAGSGRKPYTRGNEKFLRDRRQPIYKGL